MKQAEQLVRQGEQYILGMDMPALLGSSLQA
jgi:hypothetical protein